MCGVVWRTGHCVFLTISFLLAVALLASSKSIATHRPFQCDRTTCGCAGRGAGQGRVERARVVREWQLARLVRELKAVVRRC